MSKIILYYFLEHQYIERRTFSWKKKQVVGRWRKKFLFPGKKLFFSLKNEKRLTSISSIASFLVRISLNPLMFNNRKLSLSFVKKKRIFKSRKFPISIRTTDKDFHFDPLFQKSRSTIDWTNHLCDLEILEPVKFHAFSWIPFEKYTFENNLKVYFEKNSFRYEVQKIYQIDIELINLCLLQIHQSRRDLDFMVSRKYFF